MIYIYRKNERETFSQEQLKVMRTIVEDYKHESR